MSYITKIVGLAIESAEENQLNNVSTVEIEVGEMTGALPELLEKAYREVIPDTPLKNSVLKIQLVPVTAVCDSCGSTYHPAKDNDYCCVNCGSKKSRILSGREVTLISLSE